MIRLFVDGKLVATGPVWMRHHFLDDVLSRYSNPDVVIVLEIVNEEVSEK